MKKTLKKIGLIKDFKIRYQVESDKIIELLQSDKNDIKINLYDKVFGNQIPFSSTDFQFDNLQREFSTYRESKINPKKGRAKIKFKIEPLGKDETNILGKIESYYSDLKFVIVTYGIFISIMTLTIISSANYGIEWILYITGFFIFVTIFIVLFQKFEMYNVQKALMKYFENKITNANTVHIAGRV